MSRKLILTPSDYGFFSGANAAINGVILADNNVQFDLAHIILSAVTMSGVDLIYSFVEIKDSQTKLVKQITSQSEINKWIKSSERVNTVFDNYITDELKKEEKEQIADLGNFVRNVLFAAETNSGILLYSDPKEYYKNEKLPAELTIPLSILFESIQKKDALLPIVSFDIEKKNVLKLLDVFESKEFYNYKEAQLEIDQKLNLTSRTVKLIEKAGKDLYLKNSNVLSLRNNLIKAIPMSAKIIDLFFGKLPGILADYSANILTTQLGANKTIPIYNCNAIFVELIDKSLDLYLEKKIPNFDRRDYDM